MSANLQVILNIRNEINDFMTVIFDNVLRFVVGVFQSKDNCREKLPFFNAGLEQPCLHFINSIYQEVWKELLLFTSDCCR